MKKNKYKIETLQDIINCTNENNINDFLEDLKSFLEINMFTKSMVNLFAKTNEEKKIDT